MNFEGRTSTPRTPEPNTVGEPLPVAGESNELARQEKLRAQIEELRIAQTELHGSAEHVRRLRHSIVAKIHRLEDELVALGTVGSREPESNGYEVPTAPVVPEVVQSSVERAQELERKIQRTQEILRPIPEESERRTIYEKLLHCYETELKSLPQDEVHPEPIQVEHTTASNSEDTAPQPEEVVSTQTPIENEGASVGNSSEQPPEPPQDPPEDAGEGLPEDTEPESNPLKDFEIVGGSYSRRSETARTESAHVPTEEVSSKHAERVKEAHTNLKRIRAELTELERAYIGGNMDVTVARQFGINTFNGEEARLAIGKLVAEREAELKQLEGAVKQEDVHARIGKIRAELIVLERAYHGNDAIPVAREFGVDTFNQAAAHDAIERMIVEREAELHRLEEKSKAGEQKTQPKNAAEATPAPDGQEGGTQEAVATEHTEKEKVPTLEELVGSESAHTTFDTVEKKREAAEQSGNAERVKKTETNPDAEKVKKETAPTSDTEQQRIQIDSWAERYLASQFNISREDIESVEGFASLSAPQQKFICENLAQLTLGAVQEDAARLVSKSVGARKSEMIQNYGRLFGGALAGAREVFAGGYTKLKTEKEVAARARSGGMSEHGALLAELVQNMASRGPRIHENAKGELVVDLLNIRERARDKSTRDAEWFAMNELNVVAHELAQTPSEWRGQTLGTVGSKWKLSRFFNEKVLRTKGAVQENTYAKREEEYERAKRNLEEILRKKGYDDFKIAQTFLGLDSRVHQLQTLRTNPDAIEELAHIKDKDFFTESAKQVLSGPGVYMALGALGRTFGGAAIGFFGAPIAAGILGSVRSWNRSAAELRERDRNARAGVRDGKTGALNIVAAERAEQVVLVNGKEMQNGLTAKLMRLTEQAMQAEGAEKQRLLAQLRARVEYVHDKERLHRIEYGGAHGRVSRHVALVETLGRALAYLTEEELAASTEVTERLTKTQSRLNRTLTRTEEAIIEARLKGRKSDLVKSAAVAASFSVAGALIADYFRADSVPRNPLNTEPNIPSSGTATGGAELEQVLSAGAPQEAVASYTIKQGDTLWDILSQKTVLAELGETRARENAVANIIKSLSSAELQEIGITSGDARKIYPGDTINMEKLSVLLKEQQSVIESARARFGQLPIDTDLADIIPAKVEK